MAASDSKLCLVCSEAKPLTEFYRHAQMHDGYLNRCKSCHRAKMTANRLANLERVRAYDRERGKLPHRIAARTRNTKAWRAADPRRGPAQLKLHRAVKAGRITPLPCWVCGSEKVVGHHPCYDLPLDVVWLCQPHHAQLHAGVP